MGVSSSESHDLTEFYEMLMASFGVLSKNIGFYPSLDRIVETMLGPLNLGPRGRSYNEPISRLHRLHDILDLISSICRMQDLNGYDGSTMGRQWEYTIKQLPAEYQFLDMWDRF